MPTDNQTPQTPRDRFIERLSKRKGADGQDLKLSAEELSISISPYQSLALAAIRELKPLYPKTANLLQSYWIHYVPIPWNPVKYRALWNAASSELANLPRFREYLYANGFCGTPYCWKYYARAALKDLALLPKTKALVVYDAS